MSHQLLLAQFWPTVQHLTQSCSISQLWHSLPLYNLSIQCPRPGWGPATTLQTRQETHSSACVFNITMACKGGVAVFLLRSKKFDSRWLIYRKPLAQITAGASLNKKQAISKAFDQSQVENRACFCPLADNSCYHSQHLSHLCLIVAAEQWFIRLSGNGFYYMLPIHCTAS